MRAAQDSRLRAHLSVVAHGAEAQALRCGVDTLERLLWALRLSCSLPVHMRVLLVGVMTSRGQPSSTAERRRASRQPRSQGSRALQCSQRSPLRPAHSFWCTENTRYRLLVTAPSAGTAQPVPWARTRRFLHFPHEAIDSAFELARRPLSQWQASSSRS